MCIHFGRSVCDFNITKKLYTKYQTITVYLQQCTTQKYSFIVDQIASMNIGYTHFFINRVWRFFYRDLVMLYIILVTERVRYEDKMIGINNFSLVNLNKQSKSKLISFSVSMKK